MATKTQAVMATSSPKPRRPAKAKATSAKSRGVTSIKARGTTSIGDLIRVEVYGIIVLVFAVILLLCLLSFDARDLDAAYRAAGGERHNWIGPVGAHVGNLFLTLFGVGAFLVSFLFMLVGILVLVGQKVRIAVRDAWIWALLLLSGAVLLHLGMGTERVLDHRAGGVVGLYVGEGLVALFSEIGTGIVAGTAMLIGMMLLTGRSLLRPMGRLMHRAVRSVRVWWADGLRRSADWWRELRSERAMRRVERAAPPTEVSEPESQVLAPLIPIGRRSAPPPRPGDDTPVARPPLKVAPEPSEPVAPTPEAAKAAAQPETKPSMAAPRNGDKAPPEPKIVESLAMKKGRAAELLGAEQEVFEFAAKKTYQLPSLSFLDYEAPKGEGIARELLRENARILEQKLKDFGVTGQVVEIHPGPVITMYEFKPAAGIKISRIANLADDLTMALAAMRIRIVAPIPGKDVVGIEVPNKAREIVYLKEIFSDPAFIRAKSKLVLALGKDIVGYPTATDLAKAPHLLVAGSTGSGKSVAINSFICSILYKATPDEVRMIMVDPKMLELSVYEGIPHLLLPVVTDPKKAALALKWAVAEMERRYKLMAGHGVRNILGYNAKIDKLRDLKAAEEAALAEQVIADDGLGDDEDDLDLVAVPPEEDALERLPYIVVVIDELADLMMVASKDVETAIARLAQMARAAGIHMILATQRPSVDVITGLIKANFPTRISFQVASKIDSRTILDRSGAENLLGQGDMLFLPPGTSKLNRCHGAYVSEDEIARITTFIKSQAKPKYCMEILTDEGEGSLAEEDKEYDEFYDQAVAIVAETRQASISYLQRRLKIGYNRAARIVETMEREGVVGPQNGPGPREVFIDPV